MGAAASRGARAQGARIYSLYATGQIEAGLAAAQALLAREIKRVGEKHFDAAAARGTLAVGYARAGRDADAMREFRAAVPILMASPARTPTMTIPP